MKRSLQKMLRFTLVDDIAKIKPSRMISLYADTDSWILAMATFQRDGSNHLEYAYIKDLIFDWDLLECRRAEGAEAVNRGTVPAAILELRELISSSIVLNNSSTGTVRNAVIDESTLHIDAFLVDYMEKDSPRTFLLESDWCYWSGNSESPLSIKVPLEQVRRFME